MDLIIGLVVTAILGVIGFVFGRRAERKHFAEIEVAERELQDILVFTTKRIPLSFGAGRSALVVGSVVIAEDYFKRMVSALRSFLGGRLVAYESLFDRARREAVVRMKKQARMLGAQAVFNVRFETSSLSEGNPKALFSAEMICYGTAIVARAPARP